MKIGFVGNINNYPYPLVRAFRRLGHDVRLVVDRSNRLHRPENLYPLEEVGYGERTFDVSPLESYDVAFATPRRRLVQSLLADRDALILNDMGPALWHLWRKPAFIVLSGSDIQRFANPDIRAAIAEPPVRSLRQAVRTLSKTLVYRRFVPLQRLGIRNAVGVDFFPPGVVPDADRFLSELGIDATKRTCFHVLDLEKVAFREPIQKEATRLLCATRLNWVEPLPPGYCSLDNKGTDKLLRGVALFVRRTNMPVELVLVRKGANVEETAALADQLGISPLIRWRDEMSLDQLHEEMYQADIVMEHFGPGAMGMVGRDALAMGRPVVTRSNAAAYAAHLGEAPPVLNASTPDEICTHLELLVGNRSSRARVAREGRAYVERHFNPIVAATAIASSLEQHLPSQ